MIEITVIALVALTGLGLWVKHRRQKKTMKAQQSIGRAVTVIRGQNSVIASAVLALAAVRAMYDGAVEKLKEAGDVDTSELEAASAEAEARQSELAQAIAQGTAAANEVDGTGPDDETVIPDEVDTSVVTEPALGGADEEQGGGGQAGTGEQGQGQSGGGDGTGGTGQEAGGGTQGQ